MSNPNALLIDTMRTLTFGVEIETVGASRRALANAVAAACPGARIDYAGGGYDKYEVLLADGRKWTVVSDASLSGGRGGLSGEVVTPICTWTDLEMVQAVVRSLRTFAHAKVDESCGIHVHVGAPADRFDAPALTRLAKMVYQQEELIFEALGVAARRRGQYTKDVDADFVRRLAAARPATREALGNAWYGSEYERSRNQTVHYHGSRYRGLNLHSVFYRGTVEFRYFEGTLHAGQVKAYVQFCLALATKALTSTTTHFKKREFRPETAKYDFRVFLLRLGLIGDEFETARLHLMARLKGSSSRNGRGLPGHGRMAPASPQNDAAPAPAVVVEATPAAPGSDPPAGA